ncbi:MAG TPA: hypothetical protein VJ455_04515, partial [Ignavibacteria bacterium]|nr:hypothetical protein [Ignavibacteria bacterium]
KIIESGLDFTKNRNKNFFWDLDIAFLVGDNIYSKNEKIILVTNDRDILKAARETGCANSIMSLKDYNNFISLN